MIESDLISEIILLKDGRKITIETGLLAKNANGSVVIRMGNTMLLATVVSSKEMIENLNFLPLTVDYREKYSAGGKIPGGFIKREGRPSDEEILTMRIVDRVIRPFFPKNFYLEVQIMISLLSYDENVLPDSLAALAASSALSISDIPFVGPVSEVRVIRLDKKFIINPSLNQILNSDIDIIVGGSKDSITVIEGEMKEISEEELIEIISFAHKEIKNQIEAQIRLTSKVKNINKIKPLLEKEDKNLYKKIKDFSYNDLYNISKKFYNKKKRSKYYEEIFEKIKNKFTIEYYKEKESIIDNYYSEIKKEVIRNLIINENIRLDGRSAEDIRPIWSKINYLPGVHGSAIFTRGETQSLVTVTLGSSIDANRIENAIKAEQEKFYLHYNFPPFSTGDIKQLKGVSRREIGHGNLAKRALKNIIPSETPYTIRLVSDILSSNGSSSMATICAGTLALMDSGINILRPVSGISMGLIIDNETNKEIILSDILGDEDYIGDMDFKIAGTEKGITACQMDVKRISGISFKTIKNVLNQAYKGRLNILKEMVKTISKPRISTKTNAPKIHIFDINKEFIGSIIGPGGKNIQEIQFDTDTIISIKEKNDRGIIEIIGKDQKKIDKAFNRIKYITFIPKIGKIYEVIVKSIKDFGVFVEIIPGKEYLLHISEISWNHIDDIKSILKIGEKIKIKIIGIDERNKRIKISRKILLPKNL